jgi:hypothetical protein
MKRPLNSIEDLKAWVARRPPLSREEQKARQRACERDEELASMLVWPEEWDENGIPHYNFLSPDAEKEAYAALSRVLLRTDRDLWRSGDRSWRTNVLTALALAFDATATSPTRAFLQRRSTNTGNPHDRDYEIARWVDRLRRVDGLSYNDAAEKVASILQLTPPHIKKIYGKNLKHFEPLRRKRKSGK